MIAELRGQIELVADQSRRDIFDDPAARAALKEDDWVRSGVRARRLEARDGQPDQWATRVGAILRYDEIATEDSFTLNEGGAECEWAGSGLVVRRSRRIRRWLGTWLEVYRTAGCDNHTGDREEHQMT